MTSKAETPIKRNVFRDLGFEDADEMIVKAELARRISEIIKRKNLKQEEAAKLLCVDQPKVSYLLNGRLGDFSADRLVKFLLRLGQDIEITIKRPKPPRKSGIGHVSVRAL